MTLMQVRNLTDHSDYYTSNVWHICGVYHSLSDINTLIDAGRDPGILNTLESIKCGLGKKPVEQIILTHSHFDHAGMVPKIIERYNPKIYAHPASRNSGTIPLLDRQEIQVGEEICMAVYAPGHSEDSLCLLCEEEHLLFSGDVLFGFILMIMNLLPSILMRLNCLSPQIYRQYIQAMGIKSQVMFPTS